MKPTQFSPRPTPHPASEFYDPETGNLLRSENTPGGGVQICSAREGFTSARRRNLIRYLKSEGFIPEDTRRVVWSYDPSWPYREQKFNRYSRRLAWRLLLGLTVGWMVLIGLVVLR